MLFLNLEFLYRKTIIVMATENNKYLHFIPYFQLVNWSALHWFGDSFSYSDKYKPIEIGTFLTRNKTRIEIKNDEEYRRVTIKTNNGGIFLRDREMGSNIGTKRQFIISEGQFLLSKIDARNGAFGVVPSYLTGAIVTNDFPAFDINTNIVNPLFLPLITTTKQFISFAQSSSSGTTNRKRIDLNKFLTQKIPIPSTSEQQRLVDNYNTYMRQAEAQEQQAKTLEETIESYLREELGIEQIQNQKWRNGKMYLVNFSSFQGWGMDRFIGSNKYRSFKYNIQSFVTNPNLSTGVFRGKSPLYASQSNSFVINQKCNKWNEIDLNYAKTVDTNWLNTIDKNLFTKAGDILINSTGEGTLGRASTVTNSYTNLLCDSHILLLRVNRGLIYPDFFTFVLNSNYGQQQVDSLKSAQSTNQTELGIDNLKKISFPLPPLSVQKKIAARIQSMREQIKNLRQSVEECKKRAIIEFEKEIFI
jgi:restriction endonuclease S subunit